MRGWLGVVSAAHVRRGASLGIAQINHGKRAPLARMSAGDTLIYYSPTEHRGDTVPLREFTAAGVFPDDDIWRADEGDFRPYRRRMEYASTLPVPLDQIRSALRLTAAPNWGYQLRRGHVPLDERDLALLLEVMSA